MLGVVADVAVSAAGTTPLALADAGPDERPDLVSAALLARTSGRRVEVTSLRDETSTTWVNADGSRTTDVAVAPIRVRAADGSLADVDGDLDLSDGRLRPGALPVDVSFSAGGDQALAALASDGKSARVGWTSTLPVPTVEGGIATYADVSPGMDLVVSTTRFGFEVDLRLMSRPTAPVVVRMPATMSGLSLSEATDHGLRLTDATGAVVARGAAPTMWDAASEGSAPDALAVDMDVTQEPGGAEIVLSPDMDFLQDPATVYPVIIDPPISFSVNADTFIQSNTSTVQNGSTQLRVGDAATGVHTRSYLQWLLPDWSAASTRITSATMKLWNYYSPSCTSNNVALNRVTQVWNYQTATWASGQPTVDAASIYQSGGTSLGAAGCPEGYLSWNVADLVAGWTSGTYANNGVRIASGDGNTANYKQFYSSDSTNNAKVPVLSTTYNTKPNAASLLSPLATTSSAPYYVRSLTPTISGVVTDPDADNVRGSFWMYDDATGAQVSGNGVGLWTASGTRSTYTLTSALTEGHKYRWRMKGTDGSADMSVNYTPVTTYSYLVPDATAPVAPVVTSTTHPAGQWSGADGGTATFGFAPGTSTDVVGYEYRLTENPTLVYTTATSASFPVAEGSHTLQVNSVDRAGNRSTVTLYVFDVGRLAITSPGVGDRTEAQFTLSAVAAPDATALTWKWRRSDSDSWVDLTNLTTTNGAAITQPLTLTSGSAPTVRWDAATQAGADGPLQVSVVATTPTGPATSAPRPVVVRRADFGTATAVTSVGPGSVNLLTGNFAVSATDVSVDAYGSDLTVSRTINSRAVSAEPDGPFGPGWMSSVPVTAADSEYTALAVSGNVVTLTMAGGDTVAFTKNADGSYTPEYGYEDLKLTLTSPEYDLTDLDGNVTGFTLPAGGTAYTPASVRQVGETSSTTYAYETVDVDPTAAVRNVTRVTNVVAPSMVADCAANRAQRGCRSLSFTYAPGSTIAPGSGQTGDYPHRLQKVSLLAWDPDYDPDSDGTPDPAMRTVDLAGYAYDSTGRLAQAWDPRLATLRTTYAYDAAGHLTSVTPAAEEAWTISYAAAGNDPDTGRLRAVSRPTLLTSPATTTTTFVYHVPLSGTGAPYDLSPAQLDRTAQVDRPSDATAVFPPPTTASLGSAPDTLPASWDRAAVHYLDVDGREVNTADPAGGVATTEYDARGNVVRSLSAGNRVRAFAAGAAAETSLAVALSSTTVYSPDGIEVVEALGPEHEVMLANGDLVRARAHTANTYGQGAPSGGPFHLVTTVATGARVSGATSDSDVRTSTTAYGTTTGSWQLGQPTATTVDPAGLALTTRTTYTAGGRVLTQTLPAGGTTTNTPATRVTRYYSAGADSVDAACGSRPEWANLVCTLTPGGQPATGPALPTTRTTYDMFDEPRIVTETAGGTAVRTTTTRYDGAGRSWRTAVTATAGTALPETETYYDAAGRATETRSLGSGGVVAARVTRVYNTLGQLTSYTDTDGTTSTTTYDVAGRPVVTTDGKGTQTRAYDSGSERRGLLTSLVDSQAGTWSATYDTDGSPTVDWPNGLRATTVVDEIGSPTSLDYTKVGCAADCTWFASTVHDSVHGQWLDQSSPLSSQVFGYDAAGRLASVADTVGGQCTTRLYTFDGGGAGNSNRTGLATYAPTVDGGCQTATAVSTVTSWYDTADRLTTTGTVYDALGRTTLVADADAAGSGDLTGTYYVNDLVRSLAVGTAATTYTPDVDQQRVRSWTDGTTTRTNHYEGDGDAPSWVAEGAASWTRNVGGIGGDLAAIYDSAGTATLQLTNLHGDVIATASTSNVDTAPLSTFESTEYGAGRDAVGRRYAWLGSKQRAADTPGGVSLMGVRVYNPMTGRFLQVDPVYGGNANAYIYPNDPLTDRDLDGRACLVCEGGGARFGGGAALAAWINSLLSGAGSHATVWVYELAGNKFMMQFGSTLIMVSGTSMSGLDAVVDRIHEMAHRKRVPRQQRENPHRTKSNGNAGKGKHEKADGFGPRRRLNNPNKRKDNS